MAPVLPRVPVHEQSGQGAATRSAARSAAGRHHPASALQRDVRRGAPDRRRVRHRLSTPPARDSGTGRLHRRNPQHRRAGGAPLRRRGHRREVHPPRGSRRLQGGRARGGAQDRTRGVHRHFRRGLHADRGLPYPAPSAFPRSERRDGAGALGAHQPGLLAPHQDSGDPARRPLHPRTWRAQPRRPLLQFQRHRRRLASRRHRRSRRLAARHTHRGSRPELSRAAGRLAVRLRAEPHRARRSAGRDERVQVAAAPLGERLDPDLPEAAARES